jgi:hypothetical protein
MAAAAIFNPLIVPNVIFNDRIRAMQLRHYLFIFFLSAPSMSLINVNGQLKNATPVAN